MNATRSALLLVLTALAACGGREEPAAAPTAPAVAVLFYFVSW